MLTHTSPTVSFQGITSRLAQARFPSISPLTRKGSYLKHKPTPTKIQMYPAQRVSCDTAVLQAAPQAKFQQARARRSHYAPNSNRICRQSETTRKSHNQDWNYRHGTNSVKSIPCRTVPRRPFQEMQANLYEQRPTSYQQYLPRQKVTQKAEPMSSQAQSRMSEMYDMIDDHLAWNMSMSNSESARPNSSGTMFVDFDSNGGIEVSYRKGVNKKLPTPPVPAKSLAESVPLRQDVEKKVKKMVHGEASRKYVEQECIHPHPSHSSRHDSVASSDRAKKVDPFSSIQSRSQVPQKTSRRSRPYRTRKSYPPQVHRTQSPSPALSYNPISSTPDPRGRAMCDDVKSAEFRYYASSSPSNTQRIRNTTPGSAVQTYVDGHDPTIKFENDCDDHVMHTRSSPIPSRPNPYTSEYFDILTSSYDSPSADHPDVPVKTTEKPLPRVPHSQIEPVAKKRRNSMKIVQNLLHKLDGLGPTRESRGERRRTWGNGKMKKT